MQWINGLLILLVFQCLGELIKSSLNWILPGPVIGLVLLFLFLCMRGKTADSLQACSQQLIQNLGLLFLPAATGVFFLSELTLPQWLAIAVAVLISTALSLLFNALLLKKLSAKQPTD